MELRGRRELFCRNYIQHLIGARAARDAGYANNSASQVAAHLLTEPDILERCRELAALRNAEVKLDPNDIITELLRMLVADPLECVDEFGAVKPLADIPRDARRTIASYEVDTVGTTGAVVRTKVRHYDKVKAIELLGRHLTMFKDVLKVEGMQDLAERIVAARSRDAANDAARRLAGALKAV